MWIVPSRAEKAIESGQADRLASRGKPSQIGTSRRLTRSANISSPSYETTLDQIFTKLPTGLHAKVERHSLARGKDIAKKNTPGEDDDISKEYIESVHTSPEALLRPLKQQEKNTALLNQVDLSPGKTTAAAAAAATDGGSAGPVEEDAEDAITSKANSKPAIIYQKQETSCSGSSKDPRQELKVIVDRHPEWNINFLYEQGGESRQPVWTCIYVAGDNNKFEIGRAQGGNRDSARRAAAEIALELVRKWDK